MNDQEARLIEEIRSNPYSDEPRLVYADWLEEQNEIQRSDYIREEIAFANTEQYSPESRQLEKSLSKRLKRKRPKFDVQWASEIGTLFDYLLIDWEGERFPINRLDPLVSISGISKSELIRLIRKPCPITIASKITLTRLVDQMDPNWFWIQRDREPFFDIRKHKPS